MSSSAALFGSRADPRASTFGSLEKPRLSRAAERAWWYRGAPRFALALAGSLGLILAMVPRVHADASVIVELKRPDGAAADGVVRLTKGDTKFECTTQKGRCQLSGVPGGTYNVEVVQADKPAAKAKRVMIPPSGEVKLIVAAQ